MGVKVDGVTSDSNKGEVTLTTLAERLDILQSSTNQLQGKDLVVFCTNLIECLAHAPTPVDENGAWITADRGFTVIEEYFHRTMEYLDKDSHTELVTVLLSKFCAIVSEPKGNVSPAIAVVIFIFGGRCEKTVESTIRAYVQQLESQGSGHVHTLATSLNRFYSWVSVFQYRWVIYPNALTFWILSFIKILEEKRHDDILIDVSLENIEKLFVSLVQKNGRIVAPIFFRVISGMRGTPEVIDKIAPLTKEILETLAGDSELWSRQLLQGLVELISTLFVEEQKKLERCDGRILETFRTKYTYVSNTLNCHMFTKPLQFKNLRPWRRRELEDEYRKELRRSSLKVGLYNNGNICYVNSVIQALCLTKQFMRQAIMQLYTKPCWYELSVILAHLHFFANTTINIIGFMGVFKPSSFTLGMQNDSSEFLGFLFQLLREAEDRDDIRFRNRRMASATSMSNMDEMPGSSKGQESRARSPIQYYERARLPKRVKYDIDEPAPVLKKRYFVSKVFSGILRTLIECTTCYETSMTRDNFYDLQLAFPETTDTYPYTVQSLINYYCEPELLSGENRYNCRNCGGLRNAYRSVMIEKAPRHLILVLKYFKFDPKATIQLKQIYDINSDLTISLPILQGVKHVNYDLYATIVHQGPTLDAGHYYTIGRDGSTWYQFNDSLVKAVPVTDLNNLAKFATPYLLFYRRKDVEECVPPTLGELPSVISETLKPGHKFFTKLHRW